MKTSAANIRQFREVDTFWKHYLTHTIDSFNVSEKPEKPVVDVQETVPTENNKETIRQNVKTEQTSTVYDNHTYDDDDDEDDTEYYSEIKPHFVQVEMYENEQIANSNQSKKRRRSISRDLSPTTGTASSVPYECATCGKGNKTINYMNLC